MCGGLTLVHEAIKDTPASQAWKGREVSSESLTALNFDSRTLIIQVLIY